MLAALAVLAVLTLLLTGIRVQPMPLPATDARATAGAQVGASAAARYPLSVGWLQDHTAPAVDVKGLSAILIDVRTREVLWERDPDSARAPASLTKLVTAMVVADHVRSLDQPVTVAPGADVLAIQQIEPESTVMGIHAGEVWTVRELLTGLFLLSGNDAAEALAQGIGMPRDRFIQLMNEKAQAIGMRESHFTSPVGLDAPGMYSSADDLAVAGYTIDTKYPQLVAISDQPQLNFPATATHQAVSGVNWLHSFFQGYAGATGMKTGFTDNAGGCTVATATRGDRRLIAVVLHSDNFVTDAEHLLDYGFSVNPS